MSKVGMDVSRVGRAIDVVSWGWLSLKCLVKKSRMSVMLSISLIRRNASFQVWFVMVGAKDTSKPIAIFGIMSFVLCCRI